MVQSGKLGLLAYFDKQYSLGPRHLTYFRYHAIIIVKQAAWNGVLAILDWKASVMFAEKDT